MKRIIPHLPNITATASMLFAVIALFASAVLLHGCSESELPGNGDDNNNLAALTIEVSDGGYAAAAGEKSGTRATEDGYTTQFTDGDKIGVYAVKNGAIVADVNNLCLVATDDVKGGIIWQTSDGKTPLYILGATYYAYYPWQADMTGKVTESATTANTFFAPLINGWTPDTDQSIYGKYTAQDLMTGSGEVTKSGSAVKISFSMQHRMALVVIDLPKTKYTLTDASGNSLPDYFIDAPDTKFDGFTPCRIDNTYRYLIRPATYKALSGSYTNASSVTTKWNFAANISASQYNIYQVDKATVTSKTWILQVGDFFMKDGSLLSKETALTADESAACIGVVYWMGDPTKITPANSAANIDKDNLQGDKTLAKDHPGCTHGLVVALDEVSSVWQATNASVQDWLDTNRKDEFLPVQSGISASDPLNNIQGYNNTKAIEAFNASSDNTNYQVNVVNEVVKYRDQVSAPATSSGWYVPSIKEQTLLCGTDMSDIWGVYSTGFNNVDFINKKLALVEKTTINRSILESFYRSSTEGITNAFYIHFNAGYVDHVHAVNVNMNARFSLAF